MSSYPLKERHLEIKYRAENNFCRCQKSDELMTKEGKTLKPIFLKELKILMREKANFFFLLLMPIICIVMFGSIFNNDTDADGTIHAIDQDQSQTSQNFLKQVGKLKEWIA